MDKVKINSFQFFTLLVLFELGSAIVVSVGLEAKQGAWATILLGMTGGIAIFCIYYLLHKQYPDKPLTDYVNAIVGKYIGTVISFLYIVYFLYIAARVLRDFGDLLLTSTLPETPLFVINLVMIIVIVYVLFLGLEVMARMSEFFFIFLILNGLFANFLIFFSGIINLKNLFPILGEGVGTIIKTAFPVGFTFPFGEVIVFTMILPLLNKEKTALKTGIIGIVVSGLLIAYTTMLNVVVLGAEVSRVSTFPLLMTVGKIEVAEFLERLDALVVVTLVLTMFFKISIFMYAGLSGIKSVLKLNSFRTFVFPVGLLTALCSITIAGDFSEHLKEGVDIVPYYLHLPFQAGIPIMLLLIALFRKKMMKKS
ncbi:MULTISPECIES: GerAB/ArcD/ProY family transporter [Sutcliffiella]|uniref:GerAB/ArcD/ProY family transporter n=1 Tax=Sutcliffiella TaxID=2837511 RepID=UPI0022DDA22F|nr:MULTISPECIES: endospore germination permease [Sutcliffiella]MED4015900.1 endospore germination permease [Sutcliffiella cohnii]WBL14962.1 endospore germination permease [Sutcliffiella sp. NC1]